MAAAEIGEFTTAKTSVWWDIENCAVPRGSGGESGGAHLIAHNISSALAAVGYRGPVSAVSAYGDISRIPSDVQRALSSTGVSLINVPAGVKDASDKKILVDMLLWAVDNPPPANYLLISGDRDFSNALHQLSMRRYNILLAHSPNVSHALVAAARTVWLWTSLLSGGPPQQKQDSSYSGSASSNEKFKHSPPRSTHFTCSSFSDESFYDNQLSYGSTRTDNEYKVRPVKRYASQQMSNVSKSTSTEFMQPPLGNQGGHSHITAENSGVGGMQSMQQYSQASSSAMPSMDASFSANFNHNGRSFPFAFSSPNKQSTQSVSSHQSEANHFSKAHHEFVGANNQSSQVPSKQNHHPSHPGHSKNPQNNFPSNYHNLHPQPVWPTNLVPSQPSIASGSSIPPNRHNSYPPSSRTENQAPTSGPSSSVPNMINLTISDSSTGIYPSISAPRIPGPNAPPVYRENMHMPPKNASGSTVPNNGVHAPGCQIPPPQGLVGYILQALSILRSDKMIPTEASISDCIHYGEMAMKSFEVRRALDYAIENKMIMVHKLGNNLPFFTGKGEQVWRCVNIMDSSLKHPQSMWDDIQKFLSSSAGCSAILASECRYQAASILQKSCLRNLPLGDILQVLQVMVHSKKWILAGSTGWQPISITLPVMN